MPRNLSTATMSAIALALTACGGGGGGVNSLPPPPPTPTPTPTPTAPDIIGAATTSQQFADKGGAITFVDGSGAKPSLSIADAQQLKVRYDSASGKYEVQLPSSPTWQSLALDPNVTPNSTQYTTSGQDPVFLTVVDYAGTGYKYSALAYWSDPNKGLFGGTAFGIPTPAGGVPSTGSAAYSGHLAGSTTETSFDFLASREQLGAVEGGIKLTFDFGAGSLSGNISPIIYTDQRYSLGTFNFINTVYSAGSTVFSGKFDTALSGQNAFSGQFTGPQAQELIGSFAFPYTSLTDSKMYQAGGGFVAKGP